MAKRITIRSVVVERSFARPQDTADDRMTKGVAWDKNTGISNRRPAADEAHERVEHPPRYEAPPVPEDAAGASGEASADLRADQTSHKAGSRSIALKETRARYPDRSAPSTRKVAGAFGREPKDGSSD